MPTVAEILNAARPAPTAPTARYATLAVHAESGMKATQRVEFAARLARELDARLIGVVAECLTPSVFDGPVGGYAPDQRIATLMRNLRAELQEAGEAFRRDAAGADIELRTIEDMPATALCRAARAADLIVLGPKSHAPTYQEPDPGEVVVRAGRPVLIVPDHVHRLDLGAVVFAWKDSRECRRTAAAALPFLQRAGRVVVRAVCDDALDEVVGKELADVVEGLKRQGVYAEAEIGAARDGVVQTLTRGLANHDADLLVMGAYGHARAAELVFGGVTQHFLRKPPCCVLMAH